MFILYKAEWRSSKLILDNASIPGESWSIGDRDNDIRGRLKPLKTDLVVIFFLQFARRFRISNFVLHFSIGIILFIVILQFVCSCHCSSEFCPMDRQIAKEGEFIQNVGACWPFNMHALGEQCLFGFWFKYCNYLVDMYIKTSVWRLLIWIRMLGSCWKVVLLESLRSVVVVVVVVFSFFQYLVLFE